MVTEATMPAGGRGLLERGALNSSTGAARRMTTPPPARTFPAMATAVNFPARGKVIRSDGGGRIVFAPTGTTYEVELDAPATGGKPFAGPLNVPTDIVIRGTGRKLLTVPSGGTFLVPIQGPLRIVQGRVKHLTESQLVLQAGPPVVIDLPRDTHAIDLNAGEIGVGTMVNVTLLPGAWYELP